jgi:hypothetical protein
VSGGSPELRSDGGTKSADREVRRAGGDPPDIPAESAIDELVPRLLSDIDAVETGYHLRATLSGDDPGRAAERLLDALERKVAVLGSTLEAGIDPGDPRVDVLIQCEYTVSQVASALGTITAVRGAVVLDVTDVCERALTDEEAEAADAADANDVFNELQQQVNELDYDTVVDELEDVSFPGGPDPDEEVDLEAEAGVDLADEEAEADEADGDAEDYEDLDIEGLLGESTVDDRRSSTTSTAGQGADEQKVSEAIESVELADEADEEPAAADDAGVEGPPPDADIDVESAVEGETAAAGDGPAAEAPADGPSGDRAIADEAAPDGATGDDAAAANGGPAPSSDDGSSADAPTEAGSARPGAADGGELAGTAGPAGGRPPVDDLVDELVTALESGDVGPERRQRLREALGIESTHSLDVRLEYLQKRVDNLAAYNDAWEAFLAEEGTGSQFMEEVDEQLEALSDRVDAIETGTGGDDDRVEALERRLDDLEASHDEDVARLEERLDSLQATVKSMRESLKAFSNWRDRVNELLGS